MTIVTGFRDEAANRVPATPTQSEVQVRDGSTSHLWTGRCPIAAGFKKGRVPILDGEMQMNKGLWMGLEVPLAGIAAGPDVTSLASPSTVRFRTEAAPNQRCPTLYGAAPPSMLVLVTGRSLAGG